MNITIHNTTKIVMVDNVKCRLWEGKSSQGIKITAFIAVLAINNNETRTLEFEKELKELKPPSVDKCVTYPDES